MPESGLLTVTLPISSQLYTAMFLALNTGGRKMEVWDLKKEDINFNDRKITFRKTKTGVVRSVRMVDEAFELLKELPKRMDTQQIFPGTKNIHQAFDFRAGFEKALSDA